MQQLGHSGMLNPGAKLGKQKVGTGKRLTPQEKAKLKKERERELRRRKREGKRKRSSGCQNPHPLSSVRGEPRGSTHSHEEVGPQAPPLLSHLRDGTADAARRPRFGRTGHLRPDGPGDRRPGQARRRADQVLAERGRPAVGQGEGADQEVRHAKGRTWSSSGWRWPGWPRAARRRPRRCRSAGLPAGDGRAGRRGRTGRRRRANRPSTAETTE